MKCPKCGYLRQQIDRAPEYECPRCGVVYAKVAHLSESGRERAVTSAPATIRRSKAWLILIVTATVAASWFGYDWYAERKAEEKVEKEVREVTAALKVLFLPSEGVTVGDMIENAGRASGQISDMRKRWYIVKEGARAADLRNFRVWYAGRAESLARSYRNAMAGKVAVEAASAATLAKAEISLRSGGLIAMPGVSDVARVAAGRDAARQAFADTAGELINKRAQGLPLRLQPDAVVLDEELIQAAKRINVTIEVTAK